MGNIWGFCLQTLTVSLVAAVLLLLKGLLADKLSPRWQYGIWALLALRILIPADIGRSVVLNFGVWLEMGKTAAEHTLQSAYSGAYVPVSLSHVLPFVKEAPRSVTDWLFVVYAAGVAVSLGWYFLSYGALRLQLRRGKEVGPEIRAKIEDLRLRHWLKPCRAVAVEGISSAFVCGVFRPLLVIPAGKDVDEKVLLHELLHLKHRDAWQSVFWAVLRCLHWCNPFLHGVFNRIGNDMESLCDQRVLERLEGEERREYGSILLEMANDRYARAPGTTSISNGGKNIARRITAIVRFKQYPRGMALVSVCIGLVLLSPLLLGTAAAYERDDYEPQNLQELHYAMAVARTRRCSTMAGAIDTYAKGLLNENGIYIAVASPLAKQEQIEQNLLLDNGMVSHLSAGQGLEYLDTSEGYNIYDMTQSSDGSYHVYITLAVWDFVGAQEQDWPATEDGTPIVAGTLIVPLRVFQEGDSWVVEEDAPRIQAFQRFSQVEYYGDDMPYFASKTVTCETGTITVSHRSKYHIDNTVATNGIFGWTAYDDSVDPDAVFSSRVLSSRIEYQCDLENAPVLPQERVEVKVKQLDSLVEEVTFSDWRAGLHMEEEYLEFTGSSSDGSSIASVLVDEAWDGYVHIGSGSGDTGNMETVPVLPAGYAVQIIFDGSVVETVLIEGVQG